MRILSVLLLMPLVTFAGEQELVKLYFSQDGIPNKQEVYAGEMLVHYLDKPTMGESLPEDVEVSLRNLEKSPKRKVYAVLLSKNGKSQDWYVFLINDQNNWKISAIRTLALPRVFFMVLQELESRTDRTKDEEYQHQNMLLTLQLDSELKEFLIQNVDTLDNIATEAKYDTEKATESAKKLNLNYVNYQTESGIVDVNIGGMIDNAVGYLFVPKGITIPIVSDDYYIYVEHVSGNWYVYKTT